MNPREASSKVLEDHKFRYEHSKIIGIDRDRGSRSKLLVDGIERERPDVDAGGDLGFVAIGVTNPELLEVAVH